MISLMTNFEGSAIAASDLPTFRPKHIQSPFSRASIKSEQDNGHCPMKSTKPLYYSLNAFRSNFWTMSLIY
jgi:hypothetical protein